MEQSTDNKLILYNKDLVESLRDHGGQATIQKIIDGTLSGGGLCETLKIKFEDVKLGKMIMSCVYDPALHGNPFGIANGGWHGAMLDNAAGYAGLSLAEPGYAGFTKEMTDMRFYRPVVQGMFRAYGAVLERDGPRVLCEGRIVDEHDTLYADCQLTLSIRHIEEIRLSFASMGIDL